MKKTTKKAFNVALASAMAAGAVVAVAPQASANTVTSFPDVTSTNVHYADIMTLVGEGHINGFEDGTYRPNLAVTRGQAAKIIANVLGLDTENVKDVNFKDLQKSNIYYGAIAALAEAGIINGFEDNTYRPNDTLTRGQMAKIIAGAFELEAGDTANPFTDSTNSIYKNDIVALYANGVTTGKTATTFAPNDAVKRGELASFVVRAYDKYTSNREVVETAAVVKALENGKVVVEGEELEVAPELAGFFSAKNAAALQDAQVTLVIEYVTTETVASVAATVTTGKIIGVKTLTIVAEGTTFDADGVELEVLELANNTTVENAVAEEIIAKGNVTLSNVATEKVTITGDAKVTITGDTKIETLVLPAGKKPEDVIANYNEVKDLLEGVKVEEAPVVTPAPPAPPADNTPVVTPTPLDNVVTKVLNKINAETGSADVHFTFNYVTNVITAEVKNPTKLISEVRKDLRDASYGDNSSNTVINYSNFLSFLTSDEKLALVEASNNFKIRAGNLPEQTHSIATYLDGNGIKRAELVQAVDKLVDDAIAATAPGANTLGTVGTAFNNKITFTTAKGEVYTVVITVPAQ